MAHQEDSVKRLNNFKHKGKTTEEMRRRRNEVSVELRKSRKDDQLLKKRNITFDSNLSNEELFSNDKETEPSSIDPRSLYLALQTNDKKEILNAVQSVRKLLSRHSQPPIEPMIEARLVPVFVNLLNAQSEEDNHIQFEAAWALTNIAAGTSEQTKAVIEAGAVPKFASLLISPYPHIVEQAVWAIGNIAGDGPEARDLVLSHNVMNYLLRLIESEPACPVSYLRNIVWTISNLCRNKKPPPDFNLVQPCIPYLGRLLFYEDSEVLADACWALSYLTDGPNERIQAVVDQNVIPRLVELLGSQTVTIVTPALRVIGNIVTGNDVQTEAVISANAIPKLRILLHNTRSNLVKESAWALSNITAGSTEQIQKVIDAAVLGDIIDVLRRGDFKAQREAVWAVTNFTSGCSVLQLLAFLNEGLIPAFCNVLNNRDFKCMDVVLEGIWNILQLTEKVNQQMHVSLAIEECGGLDKIEELQNHPNDQIYKKAFRIIDTYFTSEEGEGNDEVPESTTNGDTITYSAPDNVSHPFTF